MGSFELRRHKGRAGYTFDDIDPVFRDSYHTQVSFIDDGFPQCRPMIALLRDEPSGPVIYLHGHPGTRLMELVIQRSNSDGVTDKINVCIAATKNGLVLSSAPNGHTFNYRSAIVHGRCVLVEDDATKRKVMMDVTNHISSGRWEEVNPVASFQVSLVCVIKVEISALTLKFRKGIPGIQPRNVENDGPDRDVAPWTGVVPLYEHLMTPVDSGLTECATVSDTLHADINKRNKERRNYSLLSAK